MIINTGDELAMPTFETEAMVQNFTKIICEQIQIRKIKDLRNISAIRYTQLLYTRAQI